MVKVVDYLEREKQDGKTFFVLVLQGGVEPIKSEITGKIYFSAKTVTVPATFDEETCKELIGTEFAGSIQKEDCEPYNFEVEQTGDIITISTRNVYEDNNSGVIQENVIDEMVVT